VEGEHQHAHFRRALLDVRDGFLAIGQRHGHIHDDEVGAQLLGGPYGLAAIAGEADNFQVLLLRKQRAETITHDAVVVGDQDPLAR